VGTTRNNDTGTFTRSSYIIGNDLFLVALSRVCNANMALNANCGVAKTRIMHRPNCVSNKCASQFHAVAKQSKSVHTSHDCKRKNCTQSMFASVRCEFHVGQPQRQVLSHRHDETQHTTQPNGAACSGSSAIQERFFPLFSHGSTAGIQRAAEVGGSRTSRT
jgi:hypothetical protein